MPSSSDSLPGFAALGLPAPLVDALRRSGIERPFPIQAATIPDVLSGRDLLGRAATGSGKTLAFGLPMIAGMRGARAASRRPRGLVLVPTRELAIQVADTITPLARACGISVQVVAGGLPMNKQINALHNGVDILVATPGRLVDLIERRACDLREVSVSVLDEADHMCDLGFLPVVRQLLDMTPRNCQRLLFSATLDNDVNSLVSKYLTNPARHALSTGVASIDTMSHHVFRVSFEKKFDLVASIAAREGRTICFVRTKHGADRVARNLSRAGVGAGALHGGRTQAQRNKALAAFRDGSVPVLVATDVAARGIHVDDVSLVLHVDPPQDGKDYLHRSGRTARAGESGVIVLLTTPAEERSVKKMLAAAGVRPEQRDAVAGDPAVAALTGARAPSGVPLAQPHSRPAAAPHRGRPAHRPRSASGGPASASRPRPGAGRPRRPRSR
ncbi:MAG TPA: DEAD/DEAH box helicase [Jatrophihabitantaceae bacterium]|nr:DEAD/DEAH box helicase [Jatrophihabitantaceae bacterium]